MLMVRVVIEIMIRRAIVSLACLWRLMISLLTMRSSTLVYFTYCWNRYEDPRSFSFLAA